MYVYQGTMIKDDYRHDVYFLVKNLRGLITIVKSMEKMDRKRHEEEWIALILEAKKLGLSPAEVRAYIEQHKRVISVHQQ